MSGTFLLPQGSLDVQRFMNVASLPHLAKIILRTDIDASNNDSGVSSGTFADEGFAEVKPCRLTAAKQSEPESAIADQLASVDKFICSFDLGANIPTDSRLVVSGEEHGREWSIRLDIRARLNPEETANAMMEQYYCEPIPAGAQE